MQQNNRAYTEMGAGVRRAITETTIIVWKVYLWLIFLDMINEEKGILMNERTLNISDRIILIIDKFLKAQEEQILKKVQQILITKFNQCQNVNEKLLVCDILSTIVREAKSDYRETLEKYSNR